VYLVVIFRSPYRVPCLALLNTLVVFCLFNNMIASTAMIPQLIWPLLLPPWCTRAAKSPHAALVTGPAGASVLSAGWAGGMDDGSIR
jgi:hypothetical protein